MPDTPLVVLDDRTLDELVTRLALRLHVERERLIDVEELAVRLGMSARGVRGLVNRGELPDGYTLGGCRRWNWREVEQFLAGRQGRRNRRTGRGRYRRKPAAEEVGS